MLKKVNKSLDNQYGLLNSNIDFPNKPCILGIVPSMTNQRMSNGYLNLFMYLLQIRKQGEIDSDYDLSDIPFDLLISEQNDKTDITILNSIPINNINEAKKIMRNINIISYCLGNSTTGNMLNKLYSGLLERGYSREEAKEILSQIFVLQIVDNYQDTNGETKIPYATVVTVHDIFDMENTDYYFQEQKHSHFKENPFIHLKTNNNNDRYLLYKSFGEGSLAERMDEHVFERDYAKAPIINYLMSLYLINALNMSINSTMIKSFSLQNEIDNITKKVFLFCDMKKKNYSEFSEKDLEELNIYLMQEIKTIFKQNIPVKVLKDDELDELNQKDAAISSFYTVNKYFNIDNLIEGIKSRINMIYQINDNYQDDDIAYSEQSNDGIIEYKKNDAMRLQIDYLTRIFNNFINLINKVNIPDNISNVMQQNIRKYLAIKLIAVKDLILDNKLQEILNIYCDEETKNKFRI